MLLAAITAIAVARNHPLVDGNKRTAYVAMMALAASETSDDEFIDWVGMLAAPKS